MHYSAAPCEPAKTSAGCRATHQFLITLMVHTTKINLATTPTVTSARSMTVDHLVLVIPRDGQHPHGIVGIEEQDGHVVVVRADQQLLGPQWPGEGYAGLEIFAPASTHNDHDNDHDLRPLHQAFLGVFITDDRHSAMPIFLPAE